MNSTEAFTMSIKTLYIPNLDKTITAQYIANTFRDNLIAFVNPEKISIKRTHGRFWRKTNNFKEAIVEIEKWMDTEAAYEFIQNLKKNTNPTRLTHNQSGDWWYVKEDKVQPVSPITLLKGKQSNAVKPRILDEDQEDIEEYLKEVCSLVNTFAHDEESWLFDDNLFLQYEREMYLLSQSLLLPDNYVKTQI